MNPEAAKEAHKSNAENVTLKEKDAAETSKRLYAEVMPTTVRIKTDKQNGSGFFVDANGHVATASHVVIDAKEMFAFTSDGKKYRATLEKLGDTDDIAILKLQNFSNSHVKFLPTRDISTMTSGEPLYVIGNPRGIQEAKMFPVQITQAINSYEIVDKDAVANKFKLAGDKDKKDWLAALARPLLAGETRVEPGTSGAELIDKSGKLIGITSVSGKTDVQQVSYFVKSENIERLMKEASKFQFLYHRENTASSQRFLAQLRLGSSADLSSYSRCKLKDDYTEYKQSTDTVDTVKYGLAAVFDAAIAAGSHPVSAPLVGAGTLVVSLLARYAVDMIPNRLVLSGVSRTDGDPRPPFDWRLVMLRKN